MKIKLTSVILMFSFIFALIACDSGSSPGSTTDHLPGSSNLDKGLYFVGEVAAQAKYWKVINNNITEYDLEKNATNSHAYSIVINTGNIYIGGSFWNSGNKACYWTVSGNSTPVRHNLNPSDSITRSNVNSLAATGNDIFLAGYYDKNGDGNPIPAYWDKTGTVFFLPIPEGTAGEATGIVIAAYNTFYISGYYNYGTSSGKACCWKVSGSEVKRIDLTSPSVFAITKGISVSPAGVFMVGGHGEIRLFKNYACYWSFEEGVSTFHPLTNTYSTMACGNAIIEDNGIYASGCYAPDFKGQKPYYWIPTGSGYINTVEGEAFAIARDSIGNTHFAGYNDAGSAYTPSACYWDHLGVKHDLNTSNSHSYAYGMAIVE